MSDEINARPASAPEAPGMSGEGGSKNKKKNQKKRAKKKAAGGSVLSPYVTVKESEAKGRYCVASQDIEPGTVLIAERAWAWSCQEKFCSYCANPCGNAGQQCKECVVVEYCSTQCKTRHEPLHKRECPHVPTMKAIAADYKVANPLLFMVLRLLIAKDMEDSNENIFPDDDGGMRADHAEFSKLVSHKGEFQDEELKKLREAFSAWFSKCKLPYDVEEAVNLSCVITVNSHGMEDNLGQGKTIGFGLFPKVAMVNHSCSPNSVYVPMGDIMFVRSVEKIKTGDEITLKYIDQYNASWIRQNELKTSRHFVCACPRCVDPNDDLFISGYVCSKCKKGTVNYGPVTKVLFAAQNAGKSEAEEDTECRCVDCGAIVHYGELHRATQHYANVYQKASDLKNDNKMDGALEVLTRELLNVKSEHAGGKDAYLAPHPLNYIAFNAYSLAMNCARGIRDWTAAIKWCKELLKCMEYRYPTYDTEKVNYYALLAALIRENINAKRDRLTPKIKKALEAEMEEMKKKATEGQQVCRGNKVIPLYTDGGK